MMTISYDQYYIQQMSRLVEISNHDSNQLKYKIISNLKIIEYLFLLINLRIKNNSVLVFGIIIYGKIKKVDKSSPMPAGTRTRADKNTGGALLEFPVRTAMHRKSAIKYDFFLS